MEQHFAKNSLPAPSPSHSQHRMHFKLTALVLSAFASSSYAICCLSSSGSTGCARVIGNPSAAVEHGIFNANVWVPEGAKNVLTNSTMAELGEIVPLTCCCAAANELNCRNLWYVLIHAYIEHDDSRLAAASERLQRSRVST